ncbi:hypothetical protein L3Q82_015375 [Scortum barcoo]|uniref:Uncharacterized protein n=1 Tax=Scortum barcoo TaxID=214431 RepID=A0ACB8VTF9_9TELE|nr:hypothetical protein L3Q82_015375 [Scortum barcoo]
MNTKQDRNRLQQTVRTAEKINGGSLPSIQDLCVQSQETGRYIKSDTVVSSTGAPQGTVLAPLLFTLYTSDFFYNSELCHIQKYADDTAIVGCIRDDREEEYRRLVGDFAAWCHTNHLQLNTSKTKELVIRLWEVQTKTTTSPALEGAEVEAVDSYRYLGLWLDNKLNWTTHTSHLYGKTQSRMYFLRRLLRSFNICSKLLQMFYQSVVASVLFYTVVCWGGSISKKDTSRLDKLIRRAGSVVGTKLDSLVTVAESRTLDKLLDIMDNASHPLHTVISNTTRGACSVKDCSFPSAGPTGSRTPFLNQTELLWSPPNHHHCHQSQGQKSLKASHQHLVVNVDLDLSSWLVLVLHSPLHQLLFPSVQCVFDEAVRTEVSLHHLHSSQGQE